MGCWWGDHDWLEGYYDSNGKKIENEYEWKYNHNEKEWWYVTFKMCKNPRCNELKSLNAFHYEFIVGDGF